MKKSKSFQRFVNAIKPFNKQLVAGIGSQLVFLDIHSLQILDVWSDPLSKRISEISVGSNDDIMTGDGMKWTVTLWRNQRIIWRVDLENEKYSYGWHFMDAKYVYVYGFQNCAEVQYWFELDDQDGHVVQKKFTAWGKTWPGHTEESKYFIATVIYKDQVIELHDRQSGTFISRLYLSSLGISSFTFYKDMLFVGVNYYITHIPLWDSGDTSWITNANMERQVQIKLLIFKRFDL